VAGALGTGSTRRPAPLPRGHCGSPSAKKGNAANACCPAGDSARRRIAGESRVLGGRPASPSSSSGLQGPRQEHARVARMAPPGLGGGPLPRGGTAHLGPRSAGDGDAAAARLGARGPRGGRTALALRSVRAVQSGGDSVARSSAASSSSSSERGSEKARHRGGAGQPGAGLPVPRWARRETT